MFDSKLEERKNNYKKINFGLLEAREKYKLSLRKQKIDEMIFERRDVINSSLFQDNSDYKNYEIDPLKLNLDPELLKKQFNSLEELILFTKILILKEDDVNFIKFGVHLLRTSLSRTKMIPVEFLIEQGLCAELNHLLNKFSTELDLIVSILYLNYQYEIFWCFINIGCVAVSSKLTFFVEDGYIKNYLMIFKNFQKEVKIIEQLIWHLGNILGGKEIVEIIIERKIFDEVYNLLNRQAINEKIVNISIWFIGNILKFKMFENLNLLERCVQMIMLFIKTDDPELLNDCVWGLSHASETEEKKLIEYMINERLCEYLFLLDLEKRDNLLIPIIRITGNLLSNENDFCDLLIQQGCLKFFNQFILHRNNQIRREILWALSNIASGTNTQITKLVQSSLVPKIFGLINDPDYDVVIESIWCIGNLINTSNLENCVKLVDLNVFKPILFVLSTYMDSQLLILTLNALNSLFEHGKYSGYIYDYNPFVKLFIERGGQEIIDKIQYHKNEKIFALVSNLIDNYLSDLITKIDGPAI